MSDTVDAAENGPAALIVFGRDGSGKPHASSFNAADAELAEKAAGLMGMQALRVETDDHREIAGKLPKLRVFASRAQARPPQRSKAATGPLARLPGQMQRAMPASRPFHRRR